MGIFDDGFFGKDIEEIFNQLAGEGYVEYSSNGPNGKRIYRKRERGSFEKFFLERVDSPKKIYLIFDLSGKRKISCEINKSEDGKVLQVSENNSLIFSFPLENIRGKDMETKFNNGILEVAFRK